MSRKLTRSLNSMELIDVVQTPTDYHAAVEAVQKGEILGFFMIPEDFEKNAVAGNAPQLTYYYNLTIYVPGSLMFKGFKTMAVTTAGGLVQTSLVDKGAPSSVASVILQPITVNNHPLGNPWMNYSYYLSPSFTYGILELMILLITTLAITGEIKHGTSPDWLRCANNRIGTALVGKLLPHTVIFTIIGLGINALLYGYLHFPMNGSLLWMNLGMLLFVIASQSFAVIICSLVPNPRLAFSGCSLLGILAFSIAAFSFPVEAMYGAIAIFADIYPVRWYFLIYINEALNGWPLYYSRLFYVALLVFPILATLIAPLLKRALRRPVYIP
jgi:ABC-2 type transport system permease protein